MPITSSAHHAGADALMHRRRVRRLLLLGSGFVAATCLFWGVFFVLHGQLLVALLDAVGLASASGTAVLARRGQLRAASRLLSAVLFVLLCGCTAFFDVPTAAAPRSLHQYLLAFAVASSLLTREEPAWLRLGTPLAFACAWVVFASSNVGWATGVALPDAVRVPGTWINNAIALAFILVTLHVIQSDVRERNVLEIDLRDALLRGDLQLHYQPQFTDKLGVVGAEALARWDHPSRGEIPPTTFIALAEGSGLMPALGDWVLRTACLQLVAWSHDAALRPLSLAVNISASQFDQPDFVERVLAIVDQAGADPAKLKLELTESTLADDLEDLIAKMNQLKARGIRFSLDDFGTGFSSLTYLNRLPLDQLKIDQAFVRDMLGSKTGAGVAETVVQLGRRLGLDVIAEGVETEPQRSFLLAIGCRSYQGILFSPPLPGAEFKAFVASRAPRAATEPTA